MRLYRVIILWFFMLYIGQPCDDDITQKEKKVDMESNPAYVPIEMSQVEDRQTYVNLWSYIVH